MEEDPSEQYVQAERREVTVLFSDIVGFTSYSEQRGEESAYRLMRSLTKLMEESVREHGGFVHGFTGDGILAVFGAPNALENAPLCACRASLTMLQRIQEAADDLKSEHGVRPELRIGLNTGPAVVGKVQEGAKAGVTVLGDTVNFAARLQALAQPGRAVLSEKTLRLVQGLAQTTFAGEYQVKGKGERQKVYALDAICEGAGRFQTSLCRGLSLFVGREHEMDVLNLSLKESKSELRVIDLVAEPGMGKSRLLHEFRTRLGNSRGVLAGSCSPDGQGTAFKPFIELIRGFFKLTGGEFEKDVSRRLETGLMSLGLHSPMNVSLLLHLLGIKVQGGALSALDGVLIGLRTRELLQLILQVRCEISPITMIIGDIHWIDSASQELLDTIILNQGSLRLLLVLSRRPEYSPPWLNLPVVTKLGLEPVPSGDLLRLIKSRPGGEAMPEALARQVIEKAEGNPLFAEEIVSFLIEQGVLGDRNRETDRENIMAALPSTLQTLLSSRINCLSSKDRYLLQAASVIGRRFDPTLLAAVIGQDERNVDDRLGAITSTELLHFEKGGDCLFKHALVRDALYQSLLTETRKGLHSRVAEEIELRSGNRLTEEVEVLAYHYTHTNATSKAFTYLVMAGIKSLRVYSLDESDSYFHAALNILDTHPHCADLDLLTDFFVSYTSLLSMTSKVNAMLDVVARYIARLDSLGDDVRLVLIRHHYVWALIWGARYREAQSVQKQTSLIAGRLMDNRAKAYSAASEILVSTIISPMPLKDYAEFKTKALQAASDTEDAYIQSWIRFVIAWDELHRGGMKEAQDCARELMEIGRRMADPRPLGLGLSLLTWISVVFGAYEEALDYNAKALEVAITPFDHNTARNATGCALVLLGQIERGAPMLEEERRRCMSDGDRYTLAGQDAIYGLSKVFQGDIKGGIHFIEKAMLQRKKEGYQTLANWYSVFLSELFIEIVGGGQKLPLQKLIKNLPIFLKIKITAVPRIRKIVAEILSNPHIDSNGWHGGEAHMLLGLIYKAKKRRPSAIQHLSIAERIFCQYGETPMLARVRGALAEMGQGGRQ